MVEKVLNGKAEEDFDNWLRERTKSDVEVIHFKIKVLKLQYITIIEWLDSIGIYVGVFAGMYDSFNYNIQVKGTWKKWVSEATYETRAEAYIELFKIVNELYNDGQLIQMPVIEQIQRQMVETEQTKPDIKYLGIPNICFSLTDKEDIREDKFALQRRIRGFDDSETWSLSGTLASFLLPRLKRFNEVDNIERDEKYKKDMKNFISLLELEVRNDGERDFTEEEEKQINRGLNAFKRLFFRLWW